MSGRSSRRKGFDFERELVNGANERFAMRAYGSDGRSLGLAADVDLKVGPKRIQAKRVKTLRKDIKPPESCDAVCVREDRGKTLVVLDWEEYLDMLIRLYAT